MNMNEGSTETEWQVEVFFDGACPLCRREINLLRRLDRRRRVLFTDISDAGFVPEEHGKAMPDLMAQIHGRLPDRTWIVGLEVFRRLYAAVGFRRLVAATRLPLVSHGLEIGYRLFAKNRLRLTGRCSSDTCQLS